MEWTREKQESRIKKMGISHMIASGSVRNLKSVGREQTGNDGFLRASILTWHDLVIHKGYVVQGNIRCHKNVILEEGCVVCGDVTADGNIQVGRFARIYGSLTAKRNILIGKGAVIGREDAPQSVTARKDLKLSQDSCIYGKILAMQKIQILASEKEKNRELF